MFVGNYFPEIIVIDVLMVLFDIVSETGIYQSEDLFAPAILAIRIALNIKILKWTFDRIGI